MSLNLRMTGTPGVSFDCAAGALVVSLNWRITGTLGVFLNALRVSLNAKHWIHMISLGVSVITLIMHCIHHMSFLHGLRYCN